MLHRSLRGSLRALTPLARTEHAPPPLPTSCSPKPAPPCPTCEPQPHPACRAKPSERVRALRVTCYPPPAGRRPPCTAPPPPCPLTCANYSTPPQTTTPSSSLLATQMAAALETAGSVPCGTERNHVVRRLAAAECIRRTSYLRDAAERSQARPAIVPKEPYRLDTERECACATDGRVYAIAGPSGGLGGDGAGSGSDRTPPPPRCVELVPDNECQVATGDGIDPCNHQPRIFVEIDRSNQKAITEHEIEKQNRARTFDTENKAHIFEKNKCKHSAQNQQVKSSPTQHTKTPPQAGLASRLMNSFSLGRGTSGSGSEGSSGASCPSRACGTKCKLAPGAARRAGDSDWCASPPAPAPAPPRCRPPSLAERLRRRTGPRPISRCLHTAVPFLAKSTEAPILDVQKVVAETKANAEKLVSVLQERERLTEAGRGRVTSGSSSATRPASGNLDMPVPAGAARLRVRVELEGASACAPPHPAPHASACPGAAAASAHNLCTGVTKSSSWLSRLILHPKSACSLMAKDTTPCGPKKTSSPSPCGPRNASPSPCNRSSDENVRPCKTATSSGKKDKQSKSKGSSGSDTKKKSCAKNLSNNDDSVGGKTGKKGGEGRCPAPCRPAPCAAPAPRAPCDPPPTRCSTPLDALVHVIFIHI